MRKTPKDTPGLKACGCKNSNVLTCYVYDASFTGVREHYVQCQSCGSGTRVTSTKAEAQRLWNIRQLQWINPKKWRFKEGKEC